MDVVELRSLAIFESLDDDQLRRLVEAGAEVPVEPGLDLFHEGEHADAWWVLLEGAVDLVRHVGREDSVVGRMEVPGVWAGGFRAWDEHGVYLATGRGRTSGRLLRVPAEVLRDLANDWFPFGAHLIRGMYGTARSVESAARQRESLVTLGALAAGLAHELNNPAAAATRAVDALAEACATLLSSLGRLADGEISAQQFRELDALRLASGTMTSASRPDAGDPLRLADHEDRLARWLSAHGVDHAWEVAPALASAGVDVSWCERAAAVLPGSALGPGLEWVASTFAAASLLSEIKESTRRISELVGAVSSYSQMDRASRQRVDLREGLESTLVMLGHKLRPSVTVIRDYGDDVPDVEAYPGELNQVWTNLIDNAVDAMAGSGDLRIATRSPGDGTVVVEVGDTGPGLPPEVAARAFEAFYTTKDVGEGTGLGLDIARRIVVDRHRGSIDIERRAGETVATVRLPVTGPQVPPEPQRPTVSP